MTIIRPSDHSQKPLGSILGAFPIGSNRLQSIVRYNPPIGLGEPIVLYVATFRHTLDMRRIQEEKIPVADRHRFPACYVGILDTFGTYISTDGEPTAEWLQEEALRRIEEFMQIVPIVPPGYPPTRELTDGDYLLLGPVTRGTYFAPLRWFRSVDHKLIPVDSAIEKIEFHD